MGLSWSSVGFDCEADARVESSQGDEGLLEKCVEGVEWRVNDWDSGAIPRRNTLVVAWRKGIWGKGRHRLAAWGKGRLHKGDRNEADMPQAFLP